MSRPSIIPDDRRSELTHAEIARYSRHLLLPEVGLEGQKRLKAARVLLIGTGGLGAPVALYLAAAGVGKLGIVDFDFVDISNLQRQIIHSTKDINRPKVASAKDKIKAINPEIQVETYNTTLSSKNALEIIREYDLVVDGTDNYPTRYLINDACVLLGKPLVYGSIFQFEGQASVFLCRARALLPLPLSRATAAGAGALLRGRRRGRCVAGNYWHHSGRGSHQAYRRRQREPDRPSAAL
ncbi:HesA/MoeB/ThiF family protein [Klebsiella variicola]|nr:HesA/MoeB/ThiF family protein [Klebsiella variicola]